MDLSIENIIKNNFNNEEYYKEVMAVCPWTFRKFEEYVEVINFQYFVKYCKYLPTNIIEYIITEELIDIHELIMYQQLPDDTIESFFINNETELILSSLETQFVNNRILCKYKDKLNWKLVSEHQFMDLQFLIEHVKLIHWSVIPFNPKMLPHINEGFIVLFQITNIWDNIAYTDIETDVLIKYKRFFTEKTYETFLEYRDISKEQLNLM